MKIKIQYLPLVICLFLAGCRGCSSPPSPLPPPPVTEVKPWEGKVHLYLENSHSMAGYFNSRTSFAATLDRLLSDLMVADKYNGRVKTYLVSGEGVKPNVSIASFRDVLNPTNETSIAVAKSSPLHEIIDTIISGMNNDDLLILVTDAIMSGSNEQLTKYAARSSGQQYNIDQIDKLENDLMVSIDGMSKTSSARLLAFRSEFKATAKHPYFKLDNSMVKEGTFTRRPYYVILFGPQQAIEEFSENTRLLAGAEEVLDVNFDYSTYARIKPTSFIKAPRNAVVELGCVIIGDTDQPATFGILLDAAKIPEQYALDESSINLLKTGKPLMNGSFRYKLYSLEQGEYEELYTANTDDWQQEIKGYSHLMVCSIDSVSVYLQDSFSLAYVLPQVNWLNKWNADDDRNIGLDDATTFGLRNFVGGIQRGFSAEPQSYLFELPITIKNKR